MWSKKWVDIHQIIEVNFSSNFGHLPTIVSHVRAFFCSFKTQDWKNKKVIEAQWFGQERFRRQKMLKLIFLWFKMCGRHFQAFLSFDMLALALLSYQVFYKTNLRKQYQSFLFFFRFWIKPLSFKMAPVPTVSTSFATKTIYLLSINFKLNLLVIIHKWCYAKRGRRGGLVILWHKYKRQAKGRILKAPLVNPWVYIYGTEKV